MRPIRQAIGAWGGVKAGLTNIFTDMDIIHWIMQRCSGRLHDLVDSFPEIKEKTEEDWNMCKSDFCLQLKHFVDLLLSKSGWEPSCPKTPKSRRHLRLPACTQDLTWHTSDNSELHCIYQFCVPVHTWLCQRRDNEHCFLGGVLWDSRQSGGSLHPKSLRRTVWNKISYL